jgi:1,4-alpha-glucan branching enzyme
VNISYKCVGTASGIWEGFIPNVEKGLDYKYKIQSNNNGITTEKADPFALYCEKPPHTASIIWDLDYKWKDLWMKSRKDKNGIRQTLFCI